MRRNNSGFSILITIIVIVLLAALGVMGLSILTTETQMSVDTMTSAQAFFIAEGGLQYYFEQLQGDTDWTTPPSAPSGKALGNGTFTITTANATADEIDVTSTANVTGLDGGTTVRIATAHFSRGSTAPAAFAFFLRGNSPAGINFTGSAGSVTGNLSSAGNVTGIPNPPSLTLNGTSSPNSTLDFPAANYPYYLGIANNVISGAYTFAANTTYNGIYYISGGNVTFQNNAKLYGTLVLASANKSVIMDNTSGVVIDPSLDPLHPGNHNPAIVSAGVITGQTTTNLTIKRLIYTDKNSNPSITFRYSTGLNFFGTVVSMGGVDVRSNTSLTMVFDSDILINPPSGFSGGGSGTNSMSLWKET